MVDASADTSRNMPSGNLVPHRTPSSRLPRNVWAVTLTSFLTDMSTEMLTSLLPLFLFNVLGVRTAVIGLIEGIAETTASLVKVFSGWLSDRLGVRKPLAVLGYSLSTLAKPFLYFASSWGWVLGVRFTDRLGKGIRTAPRDALLADSVQEERRGLGFGLHRAGDTAGAFVGLLIALAITLLTQHDSTALTRGTFQLVVIASFFPAALAVLALALGAKDLPSRGRPDKAALLRFSNLAPNFRLFLFIFVLFTLGNSSDAFLILRAQAAGLPVNGVLGMMIVFNLVYALASTPAGILSDRVGRRRLLISGWLLFCLVYLGFAYASAPWHAWALMAVYGLYYALTEGVAKAFIADMVPSEQRGTAYGVFNASIGLAALPASLIAGLLWQGAGAWTGFGPAAPFLFGATMALLAALLLGRLPIGVQKHALPSGESN